MLSRIAESLYWIGRYVERAEDTALLLDVHLHRVLDDPELDSDAVGRRLLDVLGVPHPKGEVDESKLVRLLGYDAEGAASIVGALDAARENARGAREAISSELWECLNTTWNQLPSRRSVSTRLTPYAFFGFVRDRTAMLHGFADSTIPRDDGWHFLALGRSLERADMTGRMLATYLGHEPTDAAWVVLLRSCRAYEAYLRTYRNAVDVGRVAEFLLLDRLFPRSVYFSLAEGERCLAALDPAAATRVMVDDAARRVLGRLRTDLEYRESESLLRAMPEILQRLQEGCQAAHEAINSRYFSPGVRQVWEQEAFA